MATNNFATYSPRQSSLLIPFFVFLGSFLGAVLGAVSSINDLKDGAKEIASKTIPPIVLTIVGSDSVLGDKLGLAAAWVEGFTKNELDQDDFSKEFPLLGTVTRMPELQIHAIGSKTGLVQAHKGKVHLLVMSDPMAEQDVQALQASGIQVRCAAVIGYDAIVFVTDLHNRVPAIGEDALTEILTGEALTWFYISDLGKGNIRVLARKGSGTTDIVLRNYTGNTKWAKTFISCKDNDHCMSDALDMRGSIYWASRTWLRLQPAAFRHPMRVRRGVQQNTKVVDPLAKDFNPRDYPYKLLRGLYMYALEGNGITTSSSDLAAKFLLYVRSQRGQQHTLNKGFLSTFDSPDEVKIKLPKDFGNRDTDGRIKICTR